ncbi:MAG: YIP1 family protein [Pseudomonadota bacterium]
MAAEGIVLPRQSAKRFAGYELAFGETMLLLVLGYVLFAILALIIQPTGGGMALGLGHLLFFLGWVMLVLFTAWLAWLPPRLFGGRAEWVDVLPAIAWMHVLMVPFLGLALMGLTYLPLDQMMEAFQDNDQDRLQEIQESILPTDRMFSAVLVNISNFAQLWLFANFVGALHGFKTGAVAAVTLGFFLILALL